MAKIENIQQLRAEIERVEGVCKQHEAKLRGDLQQLKEEFKPINIILKSISSLTGLKLNKDDFMKDGLGFGISQFLQRIILKTEKVVENKVYDVVDTAVDALKKFMTNIVDPSARRKARMDDRENE